MKPLIDACLSPRLVSLIAPAFPGAAHVFDCGDIAKDDRLIWEFARTKGFVIVTKDNDFNRMSLLFGHPPKVIWVRVGNAGTRAVASLMLDRVSTIEFFEKDPLAALLIIDF